MKYLDWSEIKNTLLKAERDVCFEDVQTAMEDGKILDNLKHPNQKHYREQMVYIIEINNYAYLVPYVEDDEKIFLKTIIPNRKATKKYLKGDSHD